MRLQKVGHIHPAKEGWLFRGIVFRSGFSVNFTPSTILGEVEEPTLLGRYRKMQPSSSGASAAS